MDWRRLFAVWRESSFPPAEARPRYSTGFKIFLAGWVLAGLGFLCFRYVSEELSLPLIVVGVGIAGWFRFPSDWRRTWPQDFPLLRRLFGETKAIDDALARGRFSLEPSESGDEVGEPKVTRHEDGSILVSLRAPKLISETIRVQHKGRGHFLVTARSRPNENHDRRGETEFVIDLNLPDDVDGTATPTYWDPTLEILVKPD
jgi:hypothetical protein